jgi:hypothetical protein
MIQQNPSKLWITFDNNEYLLMIVKWVSIARSAKSNVAKQKIIYGSWW